MVEKDAEALAASAREAKTEAEFKQIRKSIQPLKKKNDDLLLVLETCLDNADPLAVKLAEEIATDLVQWKAASVEDGSRIVEQLMRKDLKKIQALSPDEQDKIYSAYADFSSGFTNIIENHSVGKQLSVTLIPFVILLYEKYSEYFAACLSGLHKLIQWQKATTKQRERLLDGVMDFYSTRPLSWFQESVRRSFVSSDLFHLQNLYNSINLVEEKGIVERLLALHDWLEKSGEIVADEGNLSHPFGINYIALYTSITYRSGKQDRGEMDALVGLVPGALRWVRADRDGLGSGARMIQDSAAPALMSIIAAFPPALHPHFPAVIDAAIGAQSQILITGMYNACSNYPEAVALCAKHTEQLVKAMPNTDQGFQTMAIMVLHKCAEKFPDAFVYHVTELEAFLEKNHTAVQTSLILKSLAVQDPNLLKGRGREYMKKLRSTTHQSVAYVHNVVEIFANISRISEEEAERAVGIMDSEILSVETGKWERESVLNAWMAVFRRTPAVIRKRRHPVYQASLSPEVADTATRLLDLIDGRSLVGVSEGVKSQEKELKNLEGRVGGVEEEVEDMDQRTVSNAPVWAKEVSALLNPRDNKDWRLVAQRLGYSAKEIRAWATQHNPTFSLLSEFYSTHKTSDGTHFLLTVLRDIHRLDAVNIIEAAELSAKDTVKEPAKPFKKAPSIFLSYQWGHQEEVKLLKEYLEREGFSCWMDIGQMGGGDNLYEELEKGIRGAKVVLLCLSEKYCVSPNCIREANLANGLGKKLIPLQMEKVAWPPPGSLGPILAEKLFIRFFQRDSEKTEDERYWPLAKYDELLGEIKGEVEPEKVPVAVQDVFLSYQWDHQAQVKLLKKQLNSEGFSCWMDIGEMGGGDSLYEAIDTGIRNCKVVVVCFNRKYAESENCTKEVYLAGGLGKPMIPLLFEDTPYPPKGRQKAILAQYSPLTFYHSLNRSRSGKSPWPEKSMDSLVRKLRACGAKSERRVRRTNSAPARSPSARLRFHLGITCSPDKVYEMKRLAQEIGKLGYTAKVSNYTETPITTVPCEVVIAALSLRFAQSKLAGAELGKVPKSGVPVVPLLLDKIKYPPSGQSNPVLAQLEPVDCTQMTNRANWKGTEELDLVLDRLEALLPDLHPIRAPRREKSSIPMAKDHVQRLGKSLPMHPLAREATEIRIQVRPPTPSTNGTHIPVAATDRRSRRRKQDSESDSDPLSSDEEEESDSEEGTTDTERKRAKEMQNGYKLPQLNQRNKPVPNPPNRRGAKQPTQVRRRVEETAEQQRRRRNSLPSSTQQPGRVHREPPSPRSQKRQNFYNSDGPKLPSVYRQRFIRY